jgi:hypothetical protein
MGRRHAAVDLGGATGYQEEEAPEAHAAALCMGFAVMGATGYEDLDATGWDCAPPFAHSLLQSFVFVVPVVFVFVLFVGFLVAG